MLWAATLCFNEHIFFQKSFFHKAILLAINVTIYNTGIHDPFNKFNFLKPINETVSVAESDYLQKPEWRIWKRNERNVGE